VPTAYIAEGTQVTELNQYGPTLGATKRHACLEEHVRSCLGGGCGLRVIVAVCVCRLQIGDFVGCEQDHHRCATLEGHVEDLPDEGRTLASPSDRLIPLDGAEVDGA